MSRPRVLGVSRDAGHPKALSLSLTEVPSDDDLRELHEFLRGWNPPPLERCPICGQSAYGSHCSIGGCPVGGDL